jgi:hypothetical protein
VRHFLGGQGMVGEADSTKGRVYTQGISPFSQVSSYPTDSKEL